MVKVLQESINAHNRKHITKQADDCPKHCYCLFITAEDQNVLQEIIKQFSAEQ